MPPLTDPIRLAAYRDALRNWNVFGYIQFELTEEAIRWIKRELQGMTFKEIKQSMHEFVAAGGAIDEVKETRSEWSDHEYHYDLRITINSKSVVYIETRLNVREPFVPDESSIVVVNIHER